MPRYRKKPVVIDAVQWDGSREIIQEFVTDDGWYISNQDLYIRTLEGDHRASLGDWIIRGVQGEYYPCKPEIFEETYEPAEGQP